MARLIYSMCTSLDIYMQNVSYVKPNKFFCPQIFKIFEILSVKSA